MVHVRIDGDGLAKLTEGLQKVTKETAPLMDRIGARMVSSTQLRITQGSFEPNAPLTRAVKQNSMPLRDRGELLGSIAHASDSHVAAWGTNKAYAAIQQTGGTITPKRARKLTIPAGPWTRTQMRRFGATPRACITGMKAAGYSVWTHKGGNVILARKGKKGAIRPLFILKDQVKIPARPFLQVDGDDWETIRSLVDEHVEKSFS